MKKYTAAGVHAAELLRVEVSGWDRAGGYFVEKTHAHVEGTRLSIHLRRAIAPHSVLFARVLHADGSAERDARLLQVARSHKSKQSGFWVHCRPAKVATAVASKPARRQD